MFRVSKNFVLYFSILSLCAYAGPVPPPNISIETQVNQEITSFEILLKKMENATTDKQAALDKLDGKLLGNLTQVIQRAITAEKKIVVLLQKNVLLEMKKNESEHELITLKMPLMFRNYVIETENNFPGIKAVIPPNVLNHSKFHLDVLQRKYNWIKILTEDEYSNNVLVKLLKSTLKKNFFLNENIPQDKDIQGLSKDQQKMYNEFIEKFCHGIAVSIDNINKIMEHDNFGRYPRVDLLKMFETACNKYVSLFYHAVICPANPDEEKPL